MAWMCSGCQRKMLEHFLVHVSHAAVLVCVEHLARAVHCLCDQSTQDSLVCACMCVCLCLC